MQFQTLYYDIDKTKLKYKKDENFTRFWHKNGILHLERDVVNDSIKRWNDKGILIVEIFFTNDSFMNKEYYDNGNIKLYEMHDKEQYIKYDYDINGNKI
jgi:hypothetical protein